MKKYFCFLLFLLSAALLCANEAYPPEIAAWQENDFNNQRKAAAELVRNFRNAVASGAKKFIIPSGDYRFDGEMVKNFYLHDLQDMEIDAAGATFWVDGRKRYDCVVMRRCRNIKLSNLTIDAYPLSYSQGKVTHIDPAEKSLTIRISPGFPEPLLPLWMSRPGHIKAIFFDPVKDRMRPTRLDWVSQLEKAGPGKYKVKVRNNSPFLPEGIVKVNDIMVLPYRGSRMGVALFDCEAIKQENVTIYGSGQMAFTEEGGKGGNHYKNCKVIRRPGTNRKIICSADILHSMKMEKGPCIENCEFAWACDDIINIHGFFSLVVRQTAPDEILAASLIMPEQFSGQQISFYRFGSLSSKGGAKVVKAELITDAALRKDAAQLPDEMKKQGMRSAGFYGRDFFLYRLKFDRNINVERYDLVENYQSSGNGAKLVNNYFHDAFARGILCRGDGAVIENNRIERVLLSGISMASENYFLEGLGPRNAAIRNNTLREVCIGMQGRTHHLEGAAILIYAAAADWHAARNVQLSKNIVIENNRILTAGTFGIFLANTNGGKIRNNTIDKVFYEPLPRETNAQIRKNAAAVYLCQSVNIEVDGNRITDPGPDVKKIFFYGPGVQGCGPQK